MGGCKSTKRRNEGVDDIDEEIQIIINTNAKAKKLRVRYGKGNAARGYKAEYQTYPPSTIYERVK